MRVGQRDAGRYILKIGHPDVHKTFQGLDGLYTLICAGVIDDRDRKPLSFRFFNSGNDQVEIVGGRDQIDILGILVLQLKKNLGEPFGLDLPFDFPDLFENL